MGSRVFGVITTHRRDFTLVALALALFPINISSVVGNGLDLVFLVRITSEFFPERLEQSFIDAGAGSNGDLLKVMPITAAQYELYRLMLTQPSDAEFGVDLTPTIELTEPGSNVWRVHKKNPGERLKGIWIQYSDPDIAGESTFYETQDSSSEGAIFRIVKGDEGNYLFCPNSNKVPQGYRLVDASEDSTEVPNAFVPWPDDNLFYLVRLDNYQGDELELQRLKSNLENRANIRVLDSTDGIFSFAAFRSVASQIKDAWADNSYTITVGFLGGKKAQEPNKAWLLFPLTTDECDRVEAALSEERHTEKTLAELLNQRRNSKHPVVPSDQIAATKLPYSDVSSWYELSVTPGGFGRAFRLDVSDLPRWKKKFPTNAASGLLIYEGSLFRDGKRIPEEPRIIPQQDINKGSMLWRRLELPNWKPGLESMSL